MNQTSNMISQVCSANVILLDFSQPCAASLTWIYLTTVSTQGADATG